ncbi:mRNA-decapping enzyme 1A isoform X2 [Erpetoichthys calabaricus]|uniref:mRNA-decapping enzyme 1A isoform X2 n=1 Tax=Erpetoichthys calabaricus TaxID=27687 RepID=UPI0022342C52|nr:mRNA-decapping enzyme 1A isoform X2 [Erpetoichthys calabaricus]
MEALSKAGHEMSLAALKQHDPYISHIVDVTGQVALYTFNAKANEWEKTDIEGTLFVYTRYASPYHGFTIMNRLNMKNLVEPINKDLEFQLQDPFLLYRNSNLSIYSIWFYDKNDCHRIAQLMSKVVQQEAERAQQSSPGRNSPSKINGCAEDRPVDILEMLNKAKDEYERAKDDCERIGDFDLSSSSELHRSRVLNKSISGEAIENVPSSQLQEKNFHSGHKQITVEELFGSPLPKEQTLTGHRNHGAAEKINPDTLLKKPNLVSSFPYEYHIRCSPVFQPIHSTEVSNSQTLPDLSSDSGVVIKAIQRSQAKPVSPLLSPASQSGIHSQLGTTSMAFLNQDFFHKLKLNPHHEQMPQQPLSKPGLAPSFLQSTSQLVTPECFQDPISKPVALSSMPVAPIQTLQQNKEVEVFVHSKPLAKPLPVTTAAPSMELESVFALPKCISAIG